MSIGNAINLLKLDLNRYYLIEGKSIDPSFLSKAQTIIFSYGLHAVIVYRLGQLIRKHTAKNIILYYILWPLYFILNKCVHILYGIYISPQASIDSGFYIGHFGEIYINDCVIGRNCSVHQQTSIGLYENDKKRPLIGNCVWIGAHSCILNNVVIEDYATIGAGSVVTKNVKERTLVMGNPARKIFKNYDNQHLLGMDNISSTNHRYFIMNCTNDER